MTDDAGMEYLVNGLANNDSLQELCLSNSREQITIKGWKTLCTLLEIPGSTLQKLDVNNNSIGDDGALIFANALANNSTICYLDVDYCGITPKGWEHFKKLLYDTSSINNTYKSNPTLMYLGDEHEDIVDSEDEHQEDREDVDDVITDTLYYLELNENEDKQLVAVVKILKKHSHFNIEPFFEWEF